MLDANSTDSGLVLKEPQAGAIYVYTPPENGPTNESGLTRDIRAYLTSENMPALCGVTTVRGLNISKASMQLLYIFSSE